MEVRGRQPGGAEDARQRFKQVQADLSSANRARVRHAREVLQAMAAQRMQRQRAENRQEAVVDREKGAGAVRNNAQPSVDPAQTERLQKADRSDAQGVAQRAESTRNGASETKRDRVQLSKSAQALSSHADQSRQAHLQELKQAHESGTLNTPERISKAAQRLLGD